MLRVELQFLRVWFFAGRVCENQTAARCESEFRSLEEFGDEPLKIADWHAAAERGIRDDCGEGVGIEERSLAVIAEIGLDEAGGGSRSQGVPGICGGGIDGVAIEVRAEEGGGLSGEASFDQFEPRAAERIPDTIAAAEPGKTNEGGCERRVRGCGDVSEPVGKSRIGPQAGAQFEAEAVGGALDVDLPRGVAGVIDQIRSAFVDPVGDPPDGSPLVALAVELHAVPERTVREPGEERPRRTVGDHAGDPFGQPLFGDFALPEPEGHRGEATDSEEIPQGQVFGFREEPVGLAGQNVEVWEALANFIEQDWSESRAAMEDGIYGGEGGIEEDAGWGGFSRDVGFRFLACAGECRSVRELFEGRAGADFLEGAAHGFLFAGRGGVSEEGEQSCFLSFGGVQFRKGVDGVAANFFGWVLEEVAKPGADFRLSFVVVRFGQDDRDGADEGHLRDTIARGSLVELRDENLPEFVDGELPEFAILLFRVTRHRASVRRGTPRSQDVRCA